MLILFVYSRIKMNIKNIGIPRYFRIYTFNYSYKWCDLSLGFAIPVLVFFGLIIQ